MARKNPSRMLIVLAPQDPVGRMSSGRAGKSRSRIPGSSVEQSRSHAGPLLRTGRRAPELPTDVRSRKDGRAVEFRTQPRSSTPSYIDRARVIPGRGWNVIEGAALLERTVHDCRALRRMAVAVCCRGIASPSCL